MNDSPPSSGEIDVEIDAETEARARAIIEKGLEDAIAAFYAKVRADDVIGPVFAAVVHDWTAHQRVMVDFWSQAVLGSGRYKGMPLPPHAPLRLNQSHFDRWLILWKDACAATMPEPLAQHVGAISANMSRHWSQALASIEQQAQELERKTREEKAKAADAPGGKA